MYRTVLVRYGEIALKSKPTRRKFENILLENIGSAISEVSYQLRTERGRIFIDTSETEKVASRVANLPGIVSASPTQKIRASPDEICYLAKEIGEERFSSGDSFAIRTRRTGNHRFTSEDIAELVGRQILDNVPDLSVDLDSPDYELHIEIRGEDAYLFTKIFDGIGGLPVGSQGKVLVPFSENIKSAISTVSILKRGALACPVFFKFQESPKTELINSFKKIKKFHPELKLRKISVPTLSDKIKEKYSSEVRTMVKKRMITKIADHVAKNINANALAMDFGLREMASLSLGKIQIIEEKTTLPVFYPLTGLEDKKMLEVGKRIEENLSKKELKTSYQKYSKLKNVDLEKVQEAESNIAENSFIESSLQSLDVHTH